MTSVDTILNSADYFYCDRHRCTMKKELCLRYQLGPIKMVNSSVYPDAVHNYYLEQRHIECQKCAQGADIRRSFDHVKIAQINSEYCQTIGCLLKAKTRGFC